MAQKIKLPVTNVSQVDKDLATVIMDDEARMALSNFTKFDKDVKATIVTATVADVRFCVQAYYQLQGLRITLAGQLRSIEQGKSGGSKVKDKNAPQAEVLQWLYNNILGMENEIKRAMNIWSDSNTVASWCKQVCGIGPVISAGLAAHFDVTKAPSVAHFYSYSGYNDNNDPWLGKEKAKALVRKHCPKPIVTTDQLMALAEDPECPRSLEKLRRYAYDTKKDKYTRDALEKGLAKIPYNAELKTLLWKLGESFVKVSNKPASLYGMIYKQKKLSEIEKNERLEFSDQATRKLQTTNIGKNTLAYQSYSIGKLPDAHIHSRATRFAVKLFISHLFEEMYRVEYNSEPPRLYQHVYLEHNDYIAPEVPFTPLDPTKPATKPSRPVLIY